MIYLDKTVIFATVIPICLLVILATVTIIIVVFALWKHRKVRFTCLSTATRHSTCEHAPSSLAEAVELQRYESNNKDTDDSEQLENTDNRQPKEDDPLLRESVRKFLFIANHAVINLCMILHHQVIMCTRKENKPK